MQRASTGEGHGALCVYPSILVRAAWTKAGTVLVQRPQLQTLRCGGKEADCAGPLPSCYWLVRLDYRRLREAAASEDDLLHEVC